MNIPTMEALLETSGSSLGATFANISFLCLLGSLIFYWIGLTSPMTSNDEKYSYKPDGLTITSKATSSTVLSKTSPNMQSIGLLTTLGRYCIIIANVSLFLLLVLRWKESGHFPLSNLYESLMFLSWSFTSLHLLLENTTFFKPGSSFWASQAYTKELEKTASSVNTLSFTQLMGAITTPSALFTNAFATFTLPKEMQEAAPLVPALQSNWLMMHVTVMIISYAALILGSLLSVAYLIITSLPSFKFSVISFFNKTDERLNPTIFGISLYSLSKTLDNLSYRILGIGFPFLTIGILSGAVWANEAWGSYWSWDPKETWALLTWLIFAIYLHTRLNKTDYISSNYTEDLIVTKINEDKQPAIIATFGFVVVWICYLGVNLIGEGLHSYGWLSQ